MPIWLQNLLVFSAVGGCLTFVGRQAFQTLKGRKSRLGQCCSKGCSSTVAPVDKPKTQRVVFFPAEMLRRSRKP